VWVVVKERDAAANDDDSALDSIGRVRAGHRARITAYESRVQLDIEARYSGEGKRSSRSQPCQPPPNLHHYFARPPVAPRPWLRKTLRLC
jgi:hypothetical protein